MQTQALKAAKSGGEAYRQAGLQLDDLRNSYLNTIKASSAYDVRQFKTISQTEAYTKKLREQKVHAMEAWQNRKLMNEVIKEQIDLQRAQAVSWRKDSSGRVMGDIIIPKDAISNIDSARMRLGAYNTVLRSVASETVKWGKNTQWAGRQLMVGFTVPLGIAAAATGKLAYDMDKALTQITKVYGDASSQFQESTESIRSSAMQTARNMAQTYGQSAKDTLEIQSQFAAAGKTGMELQQATAAATKARMLNEMDLQTAIEASITLQTVYGYTAEELGQKWEYINAVANQTILGAEDFATAIPKVAGINKELGGTIEDLGVLMTAFKSAGIDAAEGANALKTISFRAVSAYGKGLETFKKMTGEDLKAIVEETNGETIPTLLKMYEAMEGLSNSEKISVVKDVFGIYQGNKALLLLEQMATQSGQVAQAMAVGKNSIAENAAIANQELARMNEQPYKQIEKAIESIKIQMAETGKIVLPMVATILGWVSSLMEFFNGMGDNTKKAMLFAGVFVGMVGPLTMLLGLFANLTGNIMKMLGSFGALITRFKITDAAERAQILVGKQATAVWDQQTSAVARLTQELMELNAVMSRSTALQAGQPEFRNANMLGEGIYSTVAHPPTAPRDKNGNILRDDGSGRRVKASEATARLAAEELKLREDGYVVMAQQTAEAEDMVRATSANLAKLKLAEESHRRTATNIAAGAASAGLMASLLSDNSFVTGLGNTAFLLGSLGSIFPAMGGKAVGAMKSMDLQGSRVVRTLVKVKGAAVSALTSVWQFARSAAIPLTAAAAGIALFWAKAREDAQEAAAAIEAIAGSTDTWSEILNYNKQTPTDIAMNSGAAVDPEKLSAAMAETFKKTNAEAARAFSSYSGQKIGWKWATAINEGMKVRLTGGTEEAAQQATRVALELMGEHFSNAEFEATINAKVNFDDTDSQMEATIQNARAQMQRAMADKGSGWDRWARDWQTGQDDLTAAGVAAAKDAANQFWATYSAVDSDKRRMFLAKMYNEQEAGLREAYKKVSARMSFDEFYKTLVNRQNLTGAFGGFNREIAGAFGNNREAISNLEKMADGMNTFSRELVSASGHAGEWKDGMDFSDIATILSNTMTDGVVKTNKFGDAIVSTEQKANNLAEALKAIGSAMDADQVAAALKETITQTQDDMVDFAMNSLENEAQASADAIERELDSVMKSFDDRADALDDKYDAREENLKKRQEARQNRIESYYDSRIKKIDDTIEAEKAAEEERQRIFEAEQRRMQRMSDMYNKNIDLNAAITTGNFDEAAKIANDMSSSAAQWSAEDSNTAAGAASEKRWAALEEQKSLLEQTKTAKLEALKATEDAEEKALQRDRERAKERLDVAREASRKEYEDRKRANQLMWEDRRRKLELELQTIRAFIPRNEAELKAQADRIDAAYRKYGVKLQGYGTTWSKFIGDQMFAHQQAAANKVKSDIAWQDIGAEISKMLLKGGFGMSAAQFTSWLNGGAAPKNSVFYAKPQPTHYALSPNSMTGGIPKYHTGGIAGKTAGGAAGIPSGHRDEIPAMLLKGEGVLNRNATDMIGEENIMNLNRGKLPDNTGPWDMGMAGIGASMMAGAMKRVMMETFKAVVAAKQGGTFSGTSGPGLYGNVRLSQEQLNNAGIIMDVGRSMGASARDLTIGLMTAMQESSLRNLHSGDRDSQGLFQQRPSQGWGTVAQVTDPRYASRKFFETLFRVKDRATMPLTLAAQAVQRSAYPYAYAKWETMARQILGTSGGIRRTGFGANINMAQYGFGAGFGGGTLMPGGWYRPTKGGRVTSEYGMRVNPVTGVYKLHGGIDLGVPTGTPVYASARGMVSRAGWEDSRGNFTRIDHGNGVQTGYAHQSQMLVKPGQMVSAGQVIGRSGSTGNSTGPHLHFEYYKNGARLNPRLIIPQFKEGGYTLSGGLAELHPRETILSEPLSDDLKRGVSSFANGGGNEYNIEVNFHGGGTPNENAVKRGIKRAISEIEREKGPKRRVGDK